MLKKLLLTCNNFDQSVAEIFSASRIGTGDKLSINADMWSPRLGILFIFRTKL
jgi:hypothetical protein